MKTFLLTPLLYASLITASGNERENEPTALKQAFKDDFYIGASIRGHLLEDETSPILDLTTKQFNSTTLENLLKWQPFNPEPGVYNTAGVDAYVNFCQKNNIYNVGHVLFWHQQTPRWVYNDEAGRQLDRTKLLKRMRERVRYLAKRYGNKIHVWDVVNEAITDDGRIRDSQWTKIIGEDFIEKAFWIAAEELPADVELLYNDYSMTSEAKRAAVVKMASELKRKGVRIDGVGMQGHWSVDSPSIAVIEASIIEFAQAGLDVHITELDIDVLPRKPGMYGADISRRLEQDETMDPYRDGLPQAIQDKLANRYSNLFRLFLKHKDKIKRVTFWGTTDEYSWLNNWPIKGRTSHPLLFDRDGKPKIAFDAVVNLKRNTSEQDASLNGAKRRE